MKVYHYIEKVQPILWLRYNWKALLYKPLMLSVIQTYDKTQSYFFYFIPQNKESHKVKNMKTESTNF